MQNIHKPTQHYNDNCTKTLHNATSYAMTQLSHNNINAQQVTAHHYWILIPPHSHKHMTLQKFDEYQFIISY